jgi:hypothetical protein
MLAFITTKRGFRGLDKQYELVYVFNKDLYEYLSKDNKCIYLGMDGNIHKENFFPKNSYEKAAVHFLEIKKGVYLHFKKREYDFLRRNGGVYMSYKKDPIKNLILSQADKLLSKDKNQAFLFLDGEILKLIFDILGQEYSQNFLEKNLPYYKKIFNYINSFYRGYVYSMRIKRGAEVFADIFRFSLFMHILLYYHFDKYDLNSRGFSREYLRVLARLFIEQVHRVDFKNFIKNNLKYYRRNGWL